MGVNSIAHMNKLAGELRASMPAHFERQATQTTVASGESTTPARSVLSAGTRRGLMTASTRRGGRADSEVLQLEKDYEEVRARYEELLKQNEALKADARRRMESYIRREERYKQEIEELRDELRRTTAGLHGEGGSPMAPLHAIHGQILEGLSSLQANSKAVLQEQESDLLRAFRARLYDVQMELEAERSKKDDGALEWIERTRTLGKELDWSREEALRLDRTNQHLAKESARLRSQYALQEDDRKFLLRQVVLLKKENSALREPGAAPKADATAAPPARAAAQPLARPYTAATSASRSPQQPLHPLPGSAGVRALLAGRPSSTPAHQSRLRVTSGAVSS